MKPSIMGVSAIAVVLVSSACAFAADDVTSSASRDAGAPAAKASTKSDAKASTAAGSDAKAEAKAIRLTKPWKDMSSLSEDQKKQIAAVHRKAVQEVNAVEQRERADIMALLNDEQKAELKSLLEKDAAARKARAAAAKKSPAKGASAKASKPADDDEDAAAEEELAAETKSAGPSGK